MQKQTSCASIMKRSMHSKGRVRVTEIEYAVYPYNFKHFLSGELQLKQFLQSVVRFCHSLIHSFFQLVYLPRLSAGTASAWGGRWQSHWCWPRVWPTCCSWTTSRHTVSWRPGSHSPPWSPSWSAGRLKQHPLNISSLSGGSNVEESEGRAHSDSLPDYRLLGDDRCLVLRLTQLIPDSQRAEGVSGRHFIISLLTL